MGLTPERDLLTRRETGKKIAGVVGRAVAATALLGLTQAKEAKALTQEELGPVKHYFVGEGENKRDMGPLVFPLKDGSGVHFAIEGLENFSYPQGYAVRGIMWEVFQQFGREHVWGPPESRPYIDNIGRICQPFQKGIFQLTTNKTQELLTLAKKNEKEPFKDYIWLDRYLSQNKLQLTKPAEWDNVFDKMGDIPGRESWLEQKFIPQRQQFNDTGKTWEQVVASRLALLDQNQAIKQYFLSNPAWLEQYGLPTAIKKYTTVEGDIVVSLRCQRASLHQWFKDLPWAKAGEITVANAVLLVKEKTDGAIIPTDALLAELSDRIFDIYPALVKTFSQGGSRPENKSPNTIGPEPFVQYWKKTLEFMQKNAPEFYKEAISYVFTITPRDAEKGQGSGVNIETRTFYTDPIPTESSLPDLSLIVKSSALYHEANHVKVGLEGLINGAKYGELAAKKAEYDFQRAIGESGEDALKRITNIDDPKNKWWR